MSDAADVASEPESESPPDAVALVHPSRREALLPFLDLDDESEDSDGIYAEELEDGSFLLFTFQPFSLFAQHPDVARAWLMQLGEALAEAHDDPRGVLFFPDTVEPESQSYAEVVTEVGDEGVFIVADEGALDAAAQGMMGGLDGFDMNQLQAMAAQLLGGGGSGGEGMPGMPPEMAKMLEDVQKQLMAQFGGSQDPDDDAIDAPALPPLDKKKP